MKPSTILFLLFFFLLELFSLPTSFLLFVASLYHSPIQQIVIFYNKNLSPFFYVELLPFFVRMTMIYPVGHDSQFIHFSQELHIICCIIFLDISGIGVGCPTLSLCFLLSVAFPFSFCTGIYSFLFLFCFPDIMLLFLHSATCLE
jgi:hypothetical protein